VGAAEESGAVPTRLHKCGTNSLQAVWIAGGPLPLLWYVCVYVRLTCVVAVATLKIRRWPLKTNSLSAAHSQQPHPARADSFSHVGEVGWPHSHVHTPAATRRSSRNCSTPPAKHEGSPFLYYERESGMRQGVCFSSEMGVRYCSAGYFR
jgi:hypothetical protein